MQREHPLHPDYVLCLLPEALRPHLIRAELHTTFWEACLFIRGGGEGRPMTFMLPPEGMVTVNKHNCDDPLQSDTADS